MSSGATADIVEYVLYVGDDLGYLEDMSDLSESEGIKAAADFAKTQLYKNGWRCFVDEESEYEIGRKGRLYGRVAIRKDDMEVIAFNHAEYANHGDHSYAIVSDSRSTIEEFAKDGGYRLSAIKVEEVLVYHY